MAESEPSEIEPPRGRRRGGGLRPEWLNRNLACLFAGRAMRSASQAYLVIIVPLYLAALGYNAVSLGLMFAVVAAASAVLSALTGFLSDRFGRKFLVILLALMMAAGGVVFVVSTDFVVLTVAAAIGTIGRGGGAGSAGAFGPYYPAEQPLIAEQAHDYLRTTVFGALSFVAVLGGALGSLLAWTPGLANRAFGLPIIDGYRALFALTGLIGLAMAAVVMPVTEAHQPASRRRGTAGNKAQTAANPAEAVPAPPRLILGLSRASWRLIARFMATSATNGLAVGMLGPLLVYWFHRRYGATAADIGELYFVLNLVAATPYLLAGRMAAYFGSVSAVVMCRGTAAVMLGALVMMPNFWLAGVLYGVRMIFNTLSIPVRQSFLMGVIPPAERSSAAGMSSFPAQVGASISPYLAGYLMDQVSLDLPMELSALLQGLYVVLYYLFFRNVRPPEELGGTDAPV